MEASSRQAPRSGVSSSTSEDGDQAQRAGAEHHGQRRAAPGEEEREDDPGQHGVADGVAQQRHLAQHEEAAEEGAARRHAAEPTSRMTRVGLMPRSSAAGDGPPVGIGGGIAQELVQLRPRPASVSACSIASASRCTWSLGRSSRRSGRPPRGGACARRARPRAPRPASGGARLRPRLDEAAAATAARRCARARRAVCAAQAHEQRRSGTSGGQSPLALPRQLEVLEQVLARGSAPQRALRAAATRTSRAAARRGATRRARRSREHDGRPRGEPRTVALASGTRGPEAPAPMAAESSDHVPEAVGPLAGRGGGRDQRGDHQHDPDRLQPHDDDDDQEQGEDDLEHAASGKPRLSPEVAVEGERA